MTAINLEMPVEFPHYTYTTALQSEVMSELSKELRMFIRLRHVINRLICIEADI
jgi:hypothetical protein